MAKRGEETMGKTEKNRWLKRIHRYLREDATVDLAWMPDASGCYAGDTDHILVNPFFECTRILLHEALHGVAPDLTEQEVKRKEKQLFDELSDRQVLYLVERYLMMRNGRRIPFKRTKFRLP